MVMRSCATIVARAVYTSRLTTFTSECLHRLRPSRDSRLNNTACRAACVAGVALHRPTHRGCRAGAHKPRKIPAIITSRPPTLTKPPLSSRGNNIQVPMLTTNVRPAKLSLLNARSVCNKGVFFFLADFVVDHDLDILCLTETWLSCEDTVSATAVTHSNVLLGETVVAVVLVYFSELHTLSITQHFGPLPHLNASTYNYVLQGSLPRTLRLFVIYRPPSSSRNSQPFATFLTEFRELVECVGTKSGFIIVGDFNVRYGDDSDPHARALRDVLSDANLRQNVTDATHNRGNVLDLVITASSSSLVTGVSVNNLVTDHFAVICDLATTKPRPVILISMFVTKIWQHIIK